MDALRIRRPLAAPAIAVGPPWALIVGQDLGLRATLGAALGSCCVVRVVRTVAQAACELAATPPNLVIADVTEERGVADDVFVKLETHFASVPLIWIASPGQWAPGAREGPPSRRCAVFETPFDYRRLLGEVARLVCLPSGPSFQKPGLISGRVIAYVSTHFGTTSVEDMARAVQLSPGHLCRVFRGEMGVGPKDFLTRVRLEAAKCLLRETREKVAAIATEVGCYDAPHLARLFRNHGCAPRAYRQADWGD